jgi:hypothetical protein
MCVRIADRVLAQTAPGLLSREQFCAMELMGDLAIQTS